MADINKSRELDEEVSKDLSVTIKADIDVSGALTGLKAVQREAKAAVKALRDLELTVTVDDKVAPDYVEWSNGHISIAEYDLSVVPSAELQAALAKRKYVTDYSVLPGEKVTVQISSKMDGILYGNLREVEGPARILVNKE